MIITVLPQVLCGLPMYVKFAGSVVVALRRWMDAPEINPDDETTKRNYFDNIYKRHKPITEFMGEDLGRLGQMIDRDIAGEMGALLNQLVAGTVKVDSNWYKNLQQYYMY